MPYSVKHYLFLVYIFAPPSSLLSVAKTADVIICSIVISLFAIIIAAVVSPVCVVVEKLIYIFVICNWVITCTTKETQQHITHTTHTVSLSLLFLPLYLSFSPLSLSSRPSLPSFSRVSCSVISPHYLPLQHFLLQHH